MVGQLEQQNDQTSRFLTSFRIKSILRCSELGDSSLHRQKIRAEKQYSNQCMLFSFVCVRSLRTPTCTYPHRTSYRCRRSNHIVNIKTTSLPVSVCSLVQVSWSPVSIRFSSFFYCFNLCGASRLYMSADVIDECAGTCWCGYHRMNSSISDWCDHLR